MRTYGAHEREQTVMMMMPRPEDRCKEPRFTAADLSEMMGVTAQKMYRILRYLEEQQRVRRIVCAGYANRWTLVQ